MVVLSSVTASVIGRGILGNDPFLTLPTFHVDHLVQYPLFALLGLVAGLVGVGVLPGPVRDRGRLRLGVARPGVGAARRRWPAARRRAARAARRCTASATPCSVRRSPAGTASRSCSRCWSANSLACSLTIGIGGSGGVFAPSLFCGAMAGAAFGDIVHAIAPASGGSVGAYALIGMGAVFAGAARAPITAVVILFELTGEYSIILPLMLAIVLATGISHLISHDTVYTRKLLRRGIDIDEPADAAYAASRCRPYMADPADPDPLRHRPARRRPASSWIRTSGTCLSWTPTAPTSAPWPPTT